jgi:hypothetical protein
LYTAAHLFYFFTLVILVLTFIQLKCKTFDLFKVLFFLSSTFTFGMKIK